MASYKVITNRELNFSEDMLIIRAMMQEKRKVVHSGTKLNWTVPHHLSKYHNPLTNQPTDFYWIKNSEDYYIVIDQIGIPEWYTQKPKEETIND